MILISTFFFCFAFLVRVALVQIVALCTLSHPVDSGGWEKGKGDNRTCVSAKLGVKRSRVRSRQVRELPLEVLL